MKESFQAVVSGRVQGVGFRWFVLRNARALGLVGAVANLPDGSVRVVAEGERGDLESLAALLEEGPPASGVARVELRWGEATGSYREFSVVF